MNITQSDVDDITKQIYQISQIGKTKFVLIWEDLDEGVANMVLNATNASATELLESAIEGLNLNLLTVNGTPHL